MAVGRFLHRDIEPLTALAVGEGQHRIVGKQMALHRGHTLEHAVDHGHGLGARDVLLRLEAAVRIAGDPAVARGQLDISLCPVAGDVVEAILALVELGKERDNLGHLGAGDGCVRTERAVGITADDARIAEGGDRVVEPVASVHVAVSVRRHPELVAAVVGQQAEEDRRGLGAGDVAAGSNHAVRITHNVGVVVVSVQRRLDNGNVRINDSGVVEDDLVRTDTDGDGPLALAKDVVACDVKRLLRHSNAKGLVDNHLVVRELRRRILEVVVDGIAQVRALDVVHRVLAAAFNRRSSGRILRICGIELVAVVLVRRSGDSALGNGDHRGLVIDPRASLYFDLIILLLNALNGVAHGVLGVLRLAVVLDVIDLDGALILDAFRNWRGVGLLKLVAIVLIGRVDLALVDRQRIGLENSFFSALYFFIVPKINCRDLSSDRL